jgi:chromate transporter
MSGNAVRQTTSLSELAQLFLKLGTIGFGGPAAHIALMEDEVVRRRQWLTREEFLDYVGAANLMPGPNSTELAIEIGRDRAGWPGLLAAGISFIAPAALIVTMIAWAYVRFGQLPSALALLAGVKPVVIAIVVQALWRLGRAAVKNAWLGALSIVAAALTVAGVNELFVLLGSGLLAAMAAWRPKGGVAVGVLGPVGPMVRPMSDFQVTRALGSAAVASSVSVWPLFAIFLKIGAVLFGSGYVLLAFLRADLVERLGWLTERQLLDAVAVGQVTPGPVFTTATFIGYVLAGAPGAIAATVGVFLPAFIFVALSGLVIPRIRASRVARAGLDGVNAASLALMVVVTWQLGRAALTGWPSIVVALAAGVLLATRRVNVAWLIVGGAAVGIALGVS